MDLFQKILAWFILIVFGVAFFVGMSWWVVLDGGTWTQVFLMWGGVIGGLLGISAFCWAFAKVFGG